VRKMSKLHTDSTGAAQHKIQGKRKAERWKDGRSEMKERRAQDKTRLSSFFLLPKPFIITDVNILLTIMWLTKAGLWCSPD
jgi:hypothetical protein